MWLCTSALAFPQPGLLSSHNRPLCALYTGQRTAHDVKFKAWSCSRGKRKAQVSGIVSFA